ncbi:hypothetical protein [Mycoplasmopsis cynos]|nr:hypothetical protein [Mycoplasmopsis cynos]UWV82226.1 hypothetical protein NW067_04245 [Mycoplasmopsis cynos]
MFERLFFLMISTNLSSPQANKVLEDFNLFNSFSLLNKSTLFLESK